MHAILLLTSALVALPALCGGGGVLVAQSVPAATGLPEDGSTVEPSRGRVGALYGRARTAEGRVHEGFLRWGRNEGSWADVLDGSKALPEENAAEAARLGVWTREERERSIVYAGVRIVWEEDDYPRSAESGVRFGHLRALVVQDDGSARLELKGGSTAVLWGGVVALERGPIESGSRFRRLRVVRPNGETVELEWSDLDRVDFLPAPAEPAARPGGHEGRLHGTVHDRRGRTFTGFVAWDLDEGFPDDVLDGEDAEGREWEIPFRRIARIDRVDGERARVLRDDGRILVLTGTNDVDRDNRGIQVSDPSLGEVVLAWDDFARFEAHPPAVEVGYERFDGGTPLRGTVTTRSGEAHTGRVRWDNDEAWSWELLDGRSEGVAMSIEMGLVRRIEQISGASSRVVLRDGRSFELEESNDVGEGNKGVFVERSDGSWVGVRWDDFEALELEEGR